jgi:hypothetical protein
MALNKNGPGVYIQVNDQSDYVPSDNNQAAAIIGFASKGPVGEATLIQSSERADAIFGDPTRYTGGQGLLALHELLAITNQLYYIRCASPMQEEAKGNLLVGTSPFVGVSGIQSNYSHAFFINIANQDGVAVNSEPYFVATPSGSNPIGAIKTAVDTFLPSEAPFSFVSASDSLGYFVSNYAGSACTMNVSGYGGNVSLFSAVGGTGYAAGGGGRPVEYSLGVISTPSQAQILAQASASYFSGNGNNIRLFGTPGVAYTMLTGTAGWLANTGAYVGQMTSACSSVGNTLLSGNASAGVFNLESLHPGAGYNYVTSSTRDGFKTYGMQAIVAANKGKDVTVQINSDGATREAYKVAFVDDLSGGSGWVLDTLNIYDYGDRNTSDYYYARFGSIDSGGGFAATSVVSVPAAWGSTFTARASREESAAMQTLIFGKLIPGTYSFAGGVNGDVADEDGSVTDSDILNALIGSQASQTGIQALRDPNLSVDLAIVPGITAQQVQNELATVASETGRFNAIISPPEGLNSEQRAVAWVNGLGDGRTAALNNTYVDVYWPWVEMFDRFAGVDRYYDPAIVAAYIQLLSKIRRDTDWAIPAGIENGKVTRATDTEVKVAGNGGILYDAVINPIMKFDRDGIVVWGQKDTQRASTALDRINVRNGLISLSKVLLRVGRQFVFKPNDPILWSQIIATINPYLAELKSKRDIRKYTILCDESVNTPARVDRGELWCRIIVTPTKAAEEINFELNFTNQTGKIIL